MMREEEEGNSWKEGGEGTDKRGLQRREGGRREEEEGDTEDATQGFWETHIEGSFMMDAILVFSVRDLQRKEDFFLINTVFLSC